MTTKRPEAWSNVRHEEEIAERNSNEGQCQRASSSKRSADQHLFVFLIVHNRSPDIACTSRQIMSLHLDGSRVRGRVL